MKRFVRLFSAGLLIAIATGAQPFRAGAGQPSLAPGQASSLRPEDARVAAITYRLAMAGHGLCPEPYPLTGLLFHHLAEYLPADRIVMTHRYGLDRGPGILTVLDGSPAAEAGLVAGDVLLAVNGHAFPTGASIAAEPERKRWRKRAEASEKLLEDALRQGPAEIHVLREGREIRISLGSQPGCIARVRLARSPLPPSTASGGPPTDRLERLRLARDKDVNAFVSDDRITITTAMLDFVENDDELALILGHEMAHLILKHPPMHQGDKLLASIGIRAGTFWKREEAADRLAIRLMAAAGHDLDAVIPFWRRFLGAYDTPQIFRYHPSLGARERITREEIQAIRAQRKPNAEAF